jgi:methyl-accepting chemotaxis protein
MSNLSFKNWSLRSKVTVPVVLVGAILTLTMYHVVSLTQRSLLLTQADTSAAYVGTQIEADRQFYTENVIKPLVADNPALKPVALDEMGLSRGQIPLPATFVHGTSNIVNAKGLHTADLLSLWNINDKKGPRNEAERRALEQLAKDRTTAVSWVVDEGKPGARFFRVTADVASSATCVTCHNTHPRSPRKDFRLNDTMGALVISLPLGSGMVTAQRNTWLWTAVIGTAFLCLVVVILLIQDRFVTQPIADLQLAADKISRGDIDSTVLSSGNDEIGRLSQAFDRMRKSIQISMERLRKR